MKSGFRGHYVNVEQGNYLTGDGAPFFSNDYVVASNYLLNLNYYLSSNGISRQIVIYKADLFEVLSGVLTYLDVDGFVQTESFTALSGDEYYATLSYAVTLISIQITETAAAGFSVRTRGAFVTLEPVGNNFSIYVLAGTGTTGTWSINGSAYSSSNWSEKDEVLRGDQSQFFPITSSLTSQTTSTPEWVFVQTPLNRISFVITPVTFDKSYSVYMGVKQFF